jgi:hypothetical protein
MKPIILFRDDRYTEQECHIANSIMDVTRYRTSCKDRLVIGRYSVLPFYSELEDDLKQNGCKLINTYEQHKWIADFQYYNDLKEFTPETWDEHEFPYSDYQGPFVVKGRTNSKKHKWATHMFGQTRRDAVEAACRIMDDSHYDQQGIIYRKFIPLKTFEISPTGLPITNEWRFFYLGRNRLAYGYYWSIAENPELGTMTEEGLVFADKIAEIASQHCNFFVLDIAQKEDGDWILIEINDAQMSGLSEVDPESLYSNLVKALDKE